MTKRKTNKVKLVQQVLDVLDKCRAGTNTYADTSRATTQLRKLETVLKREAKTRKKLRQAKADNAMYVNAHLHRMGF